MSQNAKEESVSSKLQKLGAVFTEEGHTMPEWMAENTEEALTSPDLNPIERRALAYKLWVKRLQADGTVKRGETVVYPHELTAMVRAILPGNIKAKDYGEPNITLEVIANSGKFRFKK